MYGKESIIVYETFFEAAIAKEFVENPSNFNNLDQILFEVKWLRKSNPLCSNPNLKVILKKYLKKKPKKMKKNIIQESNKPSSDNDSAKSNSPSQLFQIISKSHKLTSKPLKKISCPASSISFNEKGLSTTNSVSKWVKEKKTSFKDVKQKDYCTNGKFTCRYEIQIENDREFEIAKRIIGHKVYC